MYICGYVGYNSDVVMTKSFPYCLLNSPIPPVTVMLHWPDVCLKQLLASPGQLLPQPWHRMHLSSLKGLTGEWGGPGP